MSSFSSLQKRWCQQKQELGLEELLRTRFPLFLEDTSKEGVCSTVSLLLSFGEEALCMLFEEYHGQIVLQNTLPSAARKHFLFELFSCVSQEDSIWFGLYEQGCFSNMKQDLLAEFGSLPYEELSSQQQGFIVEQSLLMKQIPSGSFFMGECALDATGKRPSEHNCDDFWLGAYPVSQALYAAIMGRHPSFFVGATKPVERVSWCDAIIFCNQLSRREGREPVYVLSEDFVARAEKQSAPYDEVMHSLSSKVVYNQHANGYRLPKDVEWEYAARAGEDTLYAGSDGHELVSWSACNSGRSTHPIGQKSPNQFGLYDMSGNVSEWVWDVALGTNNELCSAPNIPLSKERESSYRIFRGGSWMFMPSAAQINARNQDVASMRVGYVGFRIART